MQVAVIIYPRDYLKIVHYLHLVYTEEELSENINYDPLPIKDLVDPSMSNWCHCSPYILTQGRTVWWEESLEKEENIVDVSRSNNLVRLSLYDCYW